MEVIWITRRLLRNDFIPVVHRKPRDVYVRLYTLSREGATDVGGAKQRGAAESRSFQRPHCEFALV